MVRLDVVQRVMEHETGTNVIFLDACRDNPLARNLARALGTRSGEIGRGFAQAVSGVGTLISFSTQPGNVALDGTGRNSPFAAALVRRLVPPKDDLSTILIDVRNDVMRETQNKQVPWEHSALRARFDFAALTPVAETAPTGSAAIRLSEAAEAWDRSKDAVSIAELEAFIRRFGDTYYGDLAKVRLTELKQAAAQVKTIVQSVRVSASGSPAGINMPQCRSGEADLPREAINAAGSALGAYVDGALPVAIENNPAFNEWAQARFGKQGGLSVCGRLCFVLPARATIDPTASTVQVFSQEHPWGPGSLNIVDGYHVHDLQNWSGFTGPVISQMANIRVLCWTAMNWSHNLERVFEMKLVYK